jgi:hypothetical protein
MHVFCILWFLFTVYAVYFMYILKLSFLFPLVFERVSQGRYIVFFFSHRYLCVICFRHIHKNFNKHILASFLPACMKQICSR